MTAIVDALPKGRNDEQQRTDDIVTLATAMAIARSPASARVERIWRHEWLKAPAQNNQREARYGLPTDRASAGAPSGPNPV
jgi:hypothetical protein